MSFLGDSVLRSLKTRPECIRNLADTDSAIESGPNTNLGRRNAYELEGVLNKNNHTKDASFQTIRSWMHPDCGG